MPIYEKDGKKVLHVGMPKTKTMSIMAWFKREGWSVSFDHSALIYDVNPTHYHIDFLAKELPKITGHHINYFESMFVVYRDPWERMVSEYVWSVRTTDWDKFDDWLLRRIADYLVYHNVHDNHMRPFSDFKYSKSSTIQFDSVESVLRKRYSLAGRMPHQGRVLNYECPDIDDVLTDETKRVFEAIYIHGHIKS